MNSQQAMECVEHRSRVRVHSACQPAYQMAEGRVIAFTDRPTITIEDDEGNRSNWIIDLPIDIQRVTWDRQ